MKISASDIPQASIELDLRDNIVRCGGEWRLAGIANLEAKLNALKWPRVEALKFDVTHITAMDTAGAWLLKRTMHRLETDGCLVNMIGLRAEQEALMSVLNLSELLAPPYAEPRKTSLERVGLAVWPHVQQAIAMLEFFGEFVLVMMRSVAQPRRIRWRTILYNLQHAGYYALPIVGLLSFLMGIVISFQGAGQLQRYGANIFIADLVGLTILRELAPLMTAIIVAGRSGSAFAAQIGTMKVTEEIDALRTIGVAPMELLVLPKVLALIIALPLLSVYADVMGVLGGMVMAKTQLGVSYTDFLARFDDAVKLSALLVGLGKAPIFAAIIALVGCFQGFQVGNSADSVGTQTTMSVVQSIFLIIVADALFSITFSWLKI